MHGRTKHINILFHFIRELISNGLILMKYCSTDEQPVDLFNYKSFVNSEVYIFQISSKCKKFLIKGVC